MVDKVLRNDNGDLRELTDGQLSYAAYLILKEFATYDTGVGTLKISASSNDGTLIGSFIDTKRSVALGTHPVDGTEILSTQYQFRQNLSAVDTSSVARPVSYITPSDAVTSYTITSSEYEILGLYDPLTNTVDATDTGGDDVTLTVTINYDSVNGLGYTINATNGGTTWGYRQEYMVKILGSELGGDDGVHDLYFLMSRHTGTGTGAVDRFRISLYSGFVSQAPQVRNFDIKEMDDSELYDTLIGKCLQQLTNGGIGSYALQVLSPTQGTWKKISTITNETLTSTNETYLWRKINDTAPTTELLPLKLNSSYDLQIMTTAEVKGLVEVLRYQIVNSQKGTYKLAENAPAGGTWKRVGIAFSDTRQDIADISYSGDFDDPNPYTKEYTAHYRKLYSGPRYSAFYVGKDYAKDYIGDVNLGTYTKDYVKNYQRTSSKSYSGSYTRVRKVQVPKSGNYRKTYTQSQTNLYYTGIHYFTRPYTGSYTGSFTGTYQGANYSGSSQAGYVKTSYLGYTKDYHGGDKTIAYQSSYAKDYSKNYQNAYILTSAGTYEGQTIVGDVETVSNVSLWIRSA